MGDAKRRRAKFFSDHPYCCFCGGGSRAVQEDHLPPRATFKGRHWPEGYVFPACANCNQGTALQDRLFAFVAAMPAPGPQDAQAQTEWLALAADIVRDHPGILNGMFPSANEKRKITRELGLQLPPHLLASEMPFVTLPDEMIEAVDAVLVKLGKALHYLHTGLIVPPRGVVEVRRFANTEMMAGRFPSGVTERLPQRSVTWRSGKSLHEQFGYLFTRTEDGNHAMYACTFNSSMVAVLMVSCTGPFPELLTEANGAPTQRETAPTAP